MTRHRHIAALVLSAAALAACGDSGQTDITAPAPAAKVMFYNDALGAPSVNFFANDTQLTAALSSSGAVSPSGTPYGQAAVSGNYVGLQPGQYTLSARLSDTTAANHNAVVSSVSTTIADGKSYSYYQSGPYDATAKKAADAWVLEDAIPTTYDYSVANIRFVNAIYNANPGTLTLTSNDTSIHPTPPPVVIGGAVAYKTGSAFVPVPVGSYDVAISGLGALSGRIGSVVVSGGRYYTITARGNITATSTKDASFPTFDMYLNR